MCRNGRKSRVIPKRFRPRVRPERYLWAEESTADDINKRTIFKKRPDEKAMRARLMRDGVEGELIPALLRRNAPWGRCYWVRCWAVKTGPSEYRIYVDRRGMILYAGICELARKNQSQGG